MKHSKQRTKIQSLQQHQQRRGRRRFSAMVVRASILLAIFVSMLLYLGLISKITNNIASSSNDILDENYKIPTLLKPVKQMHNSESTEHEPFHNESNENKNTPAHENLLLPAKSDITVAYAVSLTSCDAGFTADGAAVLKHSIELSSYPNKNSKYSSKMIVFAHENATECTEPFRKLGYEVQIKDVPIDVSKIKGKFLREHVVKTGCCGEKEFLKLWSYTLIDYPIVVHLDLDSLILQPFDDLYDSMLNGDNGVLPVMHNKMVPKNIEAFYTKDYNMVRPGHKHPGVQGGFLVIKPSMDYFEEYKQVILEGNFKKGAGWGGKYGGYFGAQQIQGLCSYFFEELHRGANVELNRCIYNAMNDKPTKNSECIDGKETCEDCRETGVDQIKSAHFTLCQKPWTCSLAPMKQKNCKYFHESWFKIRKDFEEKHGLKTKEVEEGTNFYNDVYQGFCSGRGAANYKRVEI